jgi:glycine cleavage system aminomethyltransferase T
MYLALKQAGEEFGGLRDFGAYAMNSMRLEKGTVTQNQSKMGFILDCVS